MRSLAYREKNRNLLRQKQRKYAKENREEQNRRAREYRAHLKEKCIELLGKQCSCGIDDQEVLQIDHKHDNGSEERQDLSPRQLLCRILKFPEEYQILCANCNWLKRGNWRLRTEEVSKLRDQAIEKYGGCCKICGNSNYEILQFDHINDDGNNRKRCRTMRKRYHSYINEDHKIQLLCCNDHQRKNMRSSNLLLTGKI